MDQMLKLIPCLFLFAACSAHPAPPAPQAAPEMPLGPRLISVDKKLLVLRLPSPCIRGRYLYARSAKPIPHSDTYPVVGVLQCVDANALSAMWVCKPQTPADEFPAEPGLPVEELRQDTVARSGKCLTRFMGQNASLSAWNEKDNYADITLEVGEGDGVKVGDQFSLQGAPIANAINRTVTDFQEIGRCSVQPYKIQAAQAACRVDTQVWGFSKDAWIRGGPAVWMP